jgi:hypothetical protein
MKNSNTFGGPKIPNFREKGLLAEVTSKYS